MRSLYNAECEVSVIGSILLDADAFSDVAEVGLTAKSFFDPRLGVIFDAVTMVVEVNKPVDVVTVSEYLEAAGLLEQVGGIKYLDETVSLVPSTRNAGAYARIVSQYQYERMWLKATQDIAEVLMGTDSADHPERLGKIQQILLGVEKKESASSIVEMRPALKKYLDVVDERSKNEGIHGLLTGFDHVDHRLAGMQPGDLGIIAGRPAMGKTAYSMNIMKNVALKQGDNALVFSLEMPTTQLIQRMVAADGRIKLGLLKSGKVMGLEDQMTKFGAAVTRMKNSSGQIFFDDAAGLGITELVARAKRIHRKHGLAVILVDHIGLVESSLKTDNETLRIGQVSRLLKKLAKELGCVVIGLAQLNRGVEQRANKRPMISDLRQSGSIEQDADWIQMLYRDEYYNEDSLTPGQVEIISGKIRDGEAGTDYLNWRGEYSLMEGMPEGGFSRPVEDKKESFS